SLFLGFAVPESGHAQPIDARESPAPGSAQSGRRYAPVAVDDEATTDEGRVVDIRVLANDRGPDGGAVRVLGVAQPRGGWVLVNGDDTLRYQPNTGFTGTDEFSYTIADAGGDTASAAVRVVVVDVADAPLAESQALSTDEDMALMITLVGSDADGDPLRFAIDRLPANGSLSGTPPDVVYTPAPDYHGLDEFIFSVEDGRGGTDEGVVSIQIDPVPDAPLAQNDQATTDEGRVVDIAVLANDRDPDGGNVRVVGVTHAMNGWVLMNGDDTLRYQPYTGFTGVDGFAYTIADAEGAEASAAVRVVVADVPNAPLAENQTLSTDEDLALMITLVGSDADGDPLRFAIDRPPAHGSLSGAPPEVLYTPAADYHGPDDFVFSVEDGRGGTDTGVVSIRINSVSDVPLALDDRATTDEGRVVDIAVLANDRDPDGDGLHVVGVTRAMNGWVLVNGDDTLRYQPYTGFAGVDGFAYTIADAEGAEASAAVSVAVHRAP
ncbi:MAG: Ig-like domain-containing protein, partial [Myxococcales bacterium]|nr:Ig-like domain-containing protein [Myxococcales bacterium]